MTSFTNPRNLSQSLRRRTPLRLAAGVLAVVALVLAACGPAGYSTSANQPSAAPPTSTPAALPPTSVPATQPTTAAPTDLPAPAALTPSVTVADQAIVGGTVTVARVVSAGPGWLVIHAQKDGQPGPVLGYSPLKEGDNVEVSVQIDVAKATPTLYAMLHVDAGTVGTYEFPGPDGPVLLAGQMVSPAFAVTAGLAAAPTPESAASAPTAAPSAPAPAPAAGAGLPTPVSGEAQVELEDFQFVPKLLVVRVGTTVKFANKDKVGHTVTSDTGLFDSGILTKGQEFSFTFTQPGEYLYHCKPHGGPGGEGMSAKIVVVP